MPSLKDLKNRISSVKSTQKITKAMQMVAASKLRKAQQAAEAARPYAERMEKVLARLAKAVGDDPNAPKLLKGTGEDKTHLFIIATAERGLCGGFNGSIARLARQKADALIRDGKQVKMIFIGKKGYGILRRQFADNTEELVEITDARVEFGTVEPIGRKIVDLFEEGEFDVCTLFYARFESVMTQVPTALQLIPLKVPDADNEKTDDEKKNGPVFYEYEPDEETILNAILPRNISVQIFRALLENAASEQGARMTAMDNATRNAGEMIKKQELLYNRTRQAQITTELIEIIAGAEAL